MYTLTPNRFPPLLNFAPKNSPATMSTDPELPRASPPPTPPPIQTKPSQTADAAAIQPPENDDEEECKTPTALENRIPEPLTCPPAPRKPTKEEFSCKRRRKKYELEFFEAVNREEVESFFGASYESLGFNSSPILKRKIR